MMVLKSIPMFNELDIETLYKVSKIATLKKAAFGEIIIKKGEPGQTFYVVLVGRVSVFLAEGAKPIASIGPGEIFGELSIIDQKERTATVKAVEDVLMLEFDGYTFIDLLIKNGTIAFAVAKTFTQRLRSMIET